VWVCVGSPGCPVKHARHTGSVTRVGTRRHLLRAKDVVDGRYAEQLTVADLATVAGLSPAHFSREFSKAFGEAPHQYLLTRRLERAAQLLTTTDWTVARVAVSVGLSGVGSFTTSFKRMHGLTPTAYRSTHLAASSRALVPVCVRLAYARPQVRTFREDEAPPPALDSE